jgi:hypothetical protein
VSSEKASDGVCPGCKRQVFIPLQARPAAAPAPEPPPENRPPSPRRLRWGAVLLGLDILSAGAVLSLLLVLLVFVHEVWVGPDAAALPWIEVGVAAAAATAALFGALLCAAVPWASGAGGWARWFLFCAVLSGAAAGGLAYLQWAGPLGLPTPDAPPWLPAALVGAAALFGLSAVLAFFLLLRRVARFLGDEELSRGVGDYSALLAVAAVAVAGVLAWFALRLPGPGPDQLRLLSAALTWMRPAVLAVFLLWPLVLARRLRGLLPDPPPLDRPARGR